MEKKLKIVYLCEFSAGVDGVWNRIFNIAKELSKRHEVFVFSSNISKGSETKAPAEEIIEGVKIKRFPVKFRIGDNTLFWNYEQELKKLNPDIVHAHVFRHPHSTSLPKIARKIKARCFLTTHAPFVEKELRSPMINLLVSLYDKLFASKILNKYEKVIAISKWELPLLKKLNCKDEKIIVIPNGFPKEFVSKKLFIPKNNIKQVLFFGRIAPVKNIELLLKVFKKIIDKKYKVKLNLVGQMEKGYELVISNLINKYSLHNTISLKAPIYELNKKITLLQSADLFVLPSKREASPLSLIEAMSLGKVVLSSNTFGAKEFVKNGKNGYIFKDEEEFEKKMEFLLNNLSKTSKNMKYIRNSVYKLNWQDLAKKEETLYQSNT